MITIFPTKRENAILKKYQGDKTQQQLLADALLLHQQGELIKSLANIKIVYQANMLKEQSIKTTNINLNYRVDSQITKQLKEKS